MSAGRSGGESLVAGAWRGGRDGLRHAGRETLSRWAASLLGGLLACLGAVWALVAITRSAHHAGGLGWEREFLAGFVQRSSPSLFDAITLDAFGASVILVPLLLGVALVLARRRRPLAALTLLAAYLGAKAITLTGWTLWDRARPELVLDGRLNPHGAASFPSGHMLQAVAVYGLLAWIWARRSGPLTTIAALVLATAIAIATAVSRLRLAAHWPSDVIAGALLGLLWAAVLIFSLRAEPVPDLRERGDPAVD